MSQGANSAMASVADPPSAESGEAALLDDQKRAFLRLVSHELRTPLNSILGFSEILAAELYGPLGTPQYKEYAEIINGSGKRLLRLINQVLEIGRLEGLKMDVRPEPLDAAFEDTIGALQEDLAVRDVRVAILAPSPAPLVMADPWGLRTVLAHLLRNAAAFSPEHGEVRLRVKAEGDLVRIRVEDDGEGIEPADLPRLMLPFEQGEGALVRRAEGAGLGLTICDLTCQAMGGKLKLTSRPGEGAVACVQLRRAKAAVAEATVTP